MVSAVPALRGRSVQVVMGEGCYPHAIFKMLLVLLHREFAKIVLCNVFYIKKHGVGRPLLEVFHP